MPSRSYLALGLLAAAVAGRGAVCADEPASAATVTVEQNALHFRSDGSLSSTYVFGPHVAKPYFWPVHAPNGSPLTRPWPLGPRDAGGSLDHVHQKSVWFCHGDVIPEGLELKQRIKGVKGVDFWSEALGHGRIVCTSVDTPHKGEHSVAIVTHNDWRTADDVTILQETRRIEFMSLDQAQLYVLDIDLHAGKRPITFGDTKEGSLGVRVRDSMTEKPGKGRITNAEGKAGEKECWGRVSAWCDYSGPSGDSVVGIAILADPRNPYPTCWHSRAYGLMAANPFGREKSGFPAMKDRTDLVHLAKGEHLKLRYGLLLHSGDVQQGKVAEHYQRFKALKKEDREGK